MQNNNKESGDLIETFLLVEQRLKRYLMRFIAHRQDIEDIVQETILRAYEAAKSTEIRTPKSFLFKIAHNLALSEITKRRRSRMIEIGGLDELEVLDFERAPDNQFELDKLLQMLATTMKGLPPKCRTVFVLRKVYGFSHKEIAERMEISTSTVENHLTRALHHCRLTLPIEEDEKAHRQQGKR